MVASHPKAVLRSQLARLAEPDAFLWATGIEDTFVYNPHATTGRILDEYELTKHYELWREDLDLMGTLGVTAARYGIPWYRVQPEKNRWDWSIADAAFDRMLEHGIDPIVDLIHYGTPGWMEDGFLNPDFPDRMAEYAAAVAERYKGRIHWYTPLNEPRITAHYCGRIGWWPPNRFGWGGFTAVMMACAKGIVKTDRALHEIDPEIVCLHVDATETYETGDPAAQPEVEFRRELIYLATDLVSGRMTPNQPLYPWLLKYGAKPTELDWLVENGVTPDVLGVNMYPMFSRREISRVGNRTKFRAPYGSRAMVKEICRGFHSRYNRPVMISEIATRGSVQRRLDWLEESLAGVRELREEGVPVVGYTWWPMFSLITWAYRQKVGALHDYIVPMGLWDLRGDELERVETEVVRAYRALIAEGHRPAGLLRGGNHVS